ncbi:MAG: response regulator [Candidatus Kapabacteria bacterium]|nr:response regulator [Candidatus Kapabacteria bacterium]
MVRILVIEDEEDIQANIQDLLEIHGYEVITANDGKSGIDKVLSSNPDLIICDINMPVMNGLDLIKELRQYPEFYTIPFLFLTANVSKDSVRTGMGLGADDYITKPYKSSELIQAVEIRIEKSKKIKEIFLSKLDELKKNISFSIPHELRTPLNSIMGFSKLLLGNVSDFDSKDMENIIGHIHNSGARLLRLIENYTYFNNLSSGSLNPENITEPSTASPSNIIKEAVKSAMVDCIKGTTFEFDLCDDTPIRLSEPYFQKIIYEIMDNAIKFSDDNKPVKIVSVVSNGFYIVRTVNYGRGMERDDIKNIDSFMQFGRDKYEQQGLGLGLSIIKRLLELCRGKFQIDSILNETTTVRIYIPVSE